MTSSLVGSEMCIRDSSSRASRYSWGIRRGEMRTIASTYWTTPAPLAVSYTHLTLPTICSV
eukprot:4168005-Prorocentrum_lima.AAC.1